MRKIIVATVVLLTFAVLSSAQEKNDLIIMHSGDSVECKVVGLSDGKVSYKFLGEDLVNTVSNKSFLKIELASGRVIEGSPLVLVLDEDDWQKVVLTSNPDDVVGLTKVELDLRAKGSSLTIWKTNNKDVQEAEENIKKMAASHQCHIVFVRDKTRNGAALGWQGSNSEITGYGYRYPFMNAEFATKKMAERDEAFYADMSEGKVSYDCEGYAKYRAIMDRISNVKTFKDKDMAAINAIAAEVAGYEAAAAQCPNKDKRDFVKAAGKLRETFNGQAERYQVYK